MISFKKHLMEAKVSKKNLNKTVDIFKRLLEKKLRTKFYRFGGPKGFTEIKNGIGIMYFYDKVKAIRFNYSGGEIISITLWDRYKLGSVGNRTIDLGGVGLLAGAYKLLDLLEKGAPTGKYTVYQDPELTESKNLFEAKRIKPDEFFNLIYDNLPSGIQINAVPWGVLADIAASNDYQVPTAVRNTKKGRGKAARYDLGMLINGEDTTSTEVEAEKDYFIKITAQDKKTKSFVSVKGDQKAKEMYTKMRSALENPDVNKEMKHPDTIFGIMRNLVQVVARGTRNSLIIYGGPGIGKTFVVNQTLKEEGLAKGSDYYVVKGKITTSALYRYLYMHRDGDILVFDDTDSVWKDPEAANILKAALDSYDERTISWSSPRNYPVSKMDPTEREEYMNELDLKLKEDPSDPKAKIPSEFPYEGRIIFISNLTEDKFDSAVLSRSAKIDMTLTDEQVFLRIKSILPYMGDKTVSIDVKEEILGFIMQQTAVGAIKAPNMRTYVAAEDLYRSGLPNWKELLDYV